MDRSDLARKRMLTRALSLCLLLVATVGQAQKKDLKRIMDPGAACDSAEWKLVFHDEFNGAALEQDKWYTYLPYSDDGSDQCDGCRYMSGSNSIFRDELVQVSDGTLKLGVARRSGTWYGHSTEYEGSVIRTKGHSVFEHGRFEIRCRIPAGKGLWPAFWGFGGQTEIDVFEFCGEKPKWMKGSLHNWVKPKHSDTGKHKDVDLSLAMHDYAVEWERDEVRWYLDGELVHARSRFVDDRGRPLPACDRPPGENYRAPYFPRDEDGLSLILDLVVSAPDGYCKGPKKPVEWPADAVFEVDRVRVYQRRPEAPLRDLCAEARSLKISPAGRALRNGEEGTITLEGAHGALDWSTGAGLVITGQSEHAVTVKYSGAPGPTWIRASCAEDPCVKGPATFETQVRVTP